MSSSAIIFCILQTGKCYGIYYRLFLYEMYRLYYEETKRKAFIFTWPSALHHRFYSCGISKRHDQYFCGSDFICPGKFYALSGKMDCKNFHDLLFFCLLQPLLIFFIQMWEDIFLCSFFTRRISWQMQFFQQLL